MLKIEFIRSVFKDLEKIKSKLNIKDSEIELLNEEVRSAYTIIEHLQQRISDLENQIKLGGKQQVESQKINIPSKCLLLGDSNLQHIRKSDLADTCSVRTIARANLDLLRTWLNEKLQWTPSCCVIYCGLYDIVEGESSDKMN